MRIREVTNWPPQYGANEPGRDIPKFGDGVPGAPLLASFARSGISQFLSHKNKSDRRWHIACLARHASLAWRYEHQEHQEHD
jgi:hypothetical protein